MRADTRSSGGGSGYENRSPSSSSSGLTLPTMPSIGPKRGLPAGWRPYELEPLAGLWGAGSATLCRAALVSFARCEPLSQGWPTHLTTAPRSAWACFDSGPSSPWRTRRGGWHRAGAEVHRSSAAVTPSSKGSGKRAGGQGALTHNLRACLGVRKILQILNLKFQNFFSPPPHPLPPRRPTLSAAPSA